jgi:hypothetical protein
MTASAPAAYGRAAVNPRYRPRPRIRRERARWRAPRAARVGVAFFVEEHFARRRRRRGFAVVDGEVPLRTLPFAQADDHVAAAADIAGPRIGDGHGEAGRDRGIDRVAAPLQYGKPDPRGARLLRHHHAMARLDRALGAGTGRGRQPR